MIELVPESDVSHLNFSELFGRNAPLQVDLGCGEGVFLAELAPQYPEKNFLGIERLAGRVAKAARRAAGIGNVRILHAETTYAVRYLLPEESVEMFYLSFPDPWPKRRHHRRRVFTLEFLDSIHAALQTNGVLRVATDHADYFREIARTSRSHSGLKIFNDAPVDSHSAKLDWFNQSSFTAAIDATNSTDLPATKFEKRFRAMGVPIHRLSLRKVSPVR